MISPQLLLAGKAALAAALAWTIALAIPGEASRYPYYAPLGALLAMYPTVAGTLRSGVQKAAGRDRIFTDHGVSGTRASRPELDKLLDHLREGDEVVVWKLDRLGRNTRNLLALIDELEQRGVHLRSVAEGISTTGSMGRAMLTVMSAFAQLERDQLSERTRAGMAVAAEHGRKAGRREVTANHAKVRRARELKAQGLTPLDIGKIIGASRATVYRHLSIETIEAN